MLILLLLQLITSKNTAEINPMLKCGCKLVGRYPVGEGGIEVLPLGFYYSYLYSTWYAYKGMQHFMIERKASK